MNLIERFKQGGIDTYSYSMDTMKRMFTGEQISKSILDGPQKILMEKINQFNNDYIRTRYLNRNRSMLEPLEDIGLTDKLNWKRGVTNTLEKLFVERILQFGKGGSVDLKFVRRPNNSAYLGDRARNDLDSVCRSLKRVKDMKGAWNDTEERKKLEAFIDLCLDTFFKNIDEANNYLKTVKSMQFLPYIVSLRTGNKENMIETPTGYRTGKYWSALDTYSSLHRELIVALHINKPDVKYYNRDREHVADIRSAPVTLLFRYHMSSMVQWWVNLYFNLYKEDGSNNEMIANQLVTNNRSIPRMLNADPSVLWEGATYRGSRGSDELNIEYFRNRKALDVSSIYHNYMNSTEYPYIGSQDGSGSKYTSLSTKGFMEKLFKDVDSDIDYRLSQRLIEKKYGHRGRNHEHIYRLQHELPRNQCFGDLNGEIYNCASTGNFIGMVPLISKWQHYIEGRSNPLQGLNNLPHIITTDWDRTMIRKVVGSIDIMRKNHLLQNGLCFQLNHNVYYSDFINHEAAFGDIVSMLDYHAGNNNEFMFDARNCVSMIKHQYQKYANQQVPQDFVETTNFDGYFNYSYVRSKRYESNNIGLHSDNPECMYNTEGFNERFVTEFCLEAYDENYVKEKQRSLKDMKLALANKLTSEMEDKDEAYDEYLKELRRIMSPETFPVQDRYGRNAMLTLLDYYTSCKQTLDEIHEDGLLTEEHSSSWESINRFHDINYDKYETFEMFISEVIKCYVIPNIEIVEEQVSQDIVSDTIDALIEQQEDNSTVGRYDFSTEEGRALWAQHIRNRRSR